MKLMQKRLQPAYEMDLDLLEIEIPEEQEVQQEDGEQKGKLDLTRHHKRAKRTSKKRCWFCKSSGHYKRTCPSTYEKKLLEMESQLNPQQNH